MMRMADPIAGAGSIDYVPGFESGLGDPALLKLCAEGESAALRELVRRYQGPVYRFLVWVLGAPQEAEEAASEVFLRAWKQSQRFLAPADTALWLHRLAVGLIQDTHRRRNGGSYHISLENAGALRGPAGGAEPDASGDFDREDGSLLLVQALAQLRTVERVLLVLYYVEGREIPEIQAITGLSYRALTIRLCRARRRLRAMSEDRSEGKRK